MNIKTWQERTGNHNIRPGSVKHMLAEIAELRAELARRATHASQQGEEDADTLSVLLWLLRRLPRCYDNPPHVVQAINRIAARTGTDVSDSYNERKPVDAARAAHPGREEGGKA